MTHRFQARTVIAVLFFCFAALTIARAQQCSPPPVLTNLEGQNLFNDELENEMGSILAAGLEHDIPVIRGPLNDYLQRVGARVLKQMPPSRIAYRFVLIDEPEIDAFGFVGGHVYVSRKLALAATSEDELAGVLAHEIGHIITHQSAIELSRVFLQLGITKLETKQDVLNAYNTVLDSKQTIKRGGVSEDKHQLIADQVAVYAVVRAGYQPQSYGEFWNRVTEIHGKTGGFFSDLFGSTKPEQKRLRAILQYAATLPATCVADNSPRGDFPLWKKSVLENVHEQLTENVPGLVRKQVLDPPLRPVVFNLAFSPDGKYVLAQDDGNIYVLTREPFKFLFRISAKNARAARFTPDSTGIAFHTTTMRVERWNVASQSREMIGEINRLKGCLQTELSPRGNYLACLDDDAELTLNVFDTSTGDTIYTQKQFYTPQSFVEVLILFLFRANIDSQMWADRKFIEMGFSPDERYFLAGKRDTNLAIDLSTHAKANLPGSIKGLTGYSFAFLGNDRVVGTSYNGNAKILKFPSGETVSKMQLGDQEMAAAAHGDYLLLRPIKDSPVGVYDIAKNKITISGKKPAMDAFDNLFVVERTDGELGIYDSNTGKPVADAPLPRSSFGSITTFSAAPDLKYLAVSERSRGAVWDLEQGRRVFHIQGFTAGFIGIDGTMFMDFPKVGARESAIARLDARSGNIDGLVDQKDKSITQFGYRYIEKKANGKNGLGENINIEVSDIASKRVLWTRVFPKAAPTIALNADSTEIAFVRPLSDKAASDDANADPSLAKKLSAIKDTKSGLLIEVVDGASGNPLGRMVLDSGHAAGIKIAGDWVTLKDSSHRIKVYSLKTGDLKGILFGETIYLSAGLPLGGVETEDGRFAVYDLNTLQKVSEISLPSPFSIAKFTPDGKRLIVVTEDQVAYIIDTTQMRDKQVTAAMNK